MYWLQLIASVIIVAYPPTFEGVEFGPFALFRTKDSTLKCEPDAAPPPTKDQKEWLYNNKPINLDGIKYKKDDKGNLVVRNVDSDDKGSYTCKATNSESKGKPPAIATSTAVVLGEYDTLGTVHYLRG